MKRDDLWRLEFGARPFEGGVRFRVWAPRARRMAVEIKGAKPATVPMRREQGDVFEATVTGIGPGADYTYLIDGERERPDPVSRWQPHGVHGPSRVVDPDAYPWRDRDWTGLALDDYIIYELHTGTFTSEGTFDALATKLSYLRDLGITAVEPMPIAQFPGERNWGYDGAYPYAVQSSYGGPEGFKRMVDACHQSGLAVVLDVVYNHLGPEGNYLGEFAPCFSHNYRGPWGDALNFDGPDSDGVRRLFIENALYWLVEYHVDALRLDAIHGIFDFGARHLLTELGEQFRAEAKRLGRHAYLIAESDLDDVRVINPVEAGGYGLDAQWNDAFHHAMHAALTGDHHGYFADFGRLADIRKALEEGFVYDGRYSVYRRRRHGSSSAARPGRQFVVFTQNHDQVANALAGKRAAASLSVGEQKLAAMIMLCAPNLPMLFMGQEFGAITPFVYFTSFSDTELGRAVSEGRKKEYAHFPLGERFIDPQSPEAFTASRLDWSELTRAPHDDLLRFHRELIALRRGSRCLSNCRKDLTRVECDEAQKWLTIERSDPSGERALLLCNFEHDVREIPLAPDRSDTFRLAISGADTEAESPPPEIGPEQTSIALRGPCGVLYIGGSKP